MADQKIISKSPEDTRILSTSGKALTYSEWVIENEDKLAGKSPVEKKKLYVDYINGLNGNGGNLSSITPTFTDNTNSQSTELLELKPTNNIDLLGATDMLTNFGLSTGNITLTKASILGNSAVKALQSFKQAKNLKGINKTAAISEGIGGMADTIDKTLFSNVTANNSATTNTINAGYDMASDALLTYGGQYGKIIGTGMKTAGLVSDLLLANGIGTDLMTTTDKWLDSKLLKLTPIGLANGIFSKKSDKFLVDRDVRADIGSSYGGAYAFMDDAASKADKSYGLFSGGARDDANRQIGQAKVMQDKITKINKDARDTSTIVTNMNELLSTNYLYKLSGGIDQRYLRAAKEGGKIERIKKINLTFRKGGLINNVINLETKEIEWRPILVEDDVQEFENGDNIEPIHTELESTVEEVKTFQTGGELSKVKEASMKDGGKTEESTEEPLSNQLNVIPEGALHARKHHMENTEGLTLKGIPVIDNKGEQQAEIELNEIIFNLEVTLKLEELCKDGSDEAAIEAGKLLVQEILFNTEDRTGLISTLREGGKLEWQPLLI